jgi:hypothetical protein
LRFEKDGKRTQVGHKHRVSGKFLFEPLEIDTPSPSLVSSDVIQDGRQSAFGFLGRL